jgi:hypothetical protein
MGAWEKALPGNVNRMFEGIRTFEEAASKQTSSPILERPRRIRERGRMELDGTLASNSVVEAITILLAN